MKTTEEQRSQDAKDRREASEARQEMISKLEKKESSRSIALWAEETFGPATALSTAIRALKELTELIEKLSIISKMEKEPSLKDQEEVMLEVADVRIVLARIQRFFPDAGLTAEEAEDFKMTINRARKWKLDGHGHGQHVPDEQ